MPFFTVLSSCRSYGFSDYYRKTEGGNQYRGTNRDNLLLFYVFEFRRLNRNGAVPSELFCTVKGKVGTPDKLFFTFDLRIRHAGNTDTHGYVPVNAAERMLPDHQPNTFSHNESILPSGIRQD